MVEEHVLHTWWATTCIGGCDLNWLFFASTAFYACLSFWISMKLYVAGSFETHLFERRKQYAVAASTPIATLAADAKSPNDLAHRCINCKWPHFSGIIMPCSCKSWWFKISPAYDPNSKDTSNSHSFCFGTHWKSENLHQYSSPKHHNTITKTSPQHHHPSLRHQSITDTEQRHHQHKTKASPTYHQNITTQSLHITETRPRHHRHIT